MSNSQSTERKILITGATGLIGNQLCLELLKQGWKLTILGRQSPEKFRESFPYPCEYYSWRDPAQSEPPLTALGVDAVINLMGEPIAAQRWSTQQKEKIKTSRINSTRNLVSALKKANPELKTFISCSAIGYYGNTEDQVVDENSAGSDDFLGHVCKLWEQEALSAPGRVAVVRVGIVLSYNGGALLKMIPTFENGIGGTLGSGRQWMSWIHIQDLVRVFLECLSNPRIKGPVNGVSPEPLKNSAFTEALAKSLKTHAFFQVPSFALKLALGEMAKIVLDGQRVRPGVLEENKFRFLFPSLNLALENLFSWKESIHDRIYEVAQWVPEPKHKVYPFFADEKNLELLTPEFLNFYVVAKSTPTVQEGTEIDYKLKIHGVPAKWRSKILDWKPDTSFRDVQMIGPYSKWDHTHGFEELAGGTLLSDRVVYRLPLASVGGRIASPLIKNDIDRIFSFRRKKISELFGRTS